MIYNFDETSLNFTQRCRRKIITTRNSTKTILAQPDRIDSTSLAICIPAEGYALETTMLWAQDSIPEEFKQFPAHRIRVQCGKDSYQTRKTFQKMMLGYYLPEMIHIRKQMDKTATPILLILDGYSSRIYFCIYPGPLEDLQVLGGEMGRKKKKGTVGRF